MIWRSVVALALLVCVGAAWCSFGQETAVPQSMTGAYLSLIVLLVALALWAIPPLFICYRIATRKGKSPGLWLFLGFLFGWIAVLVIAAAASERGTLKPE